jgi:hypothetical protein
LNAFGVEVEAYLIWFGTSSSKALSLSSAFNKTPSFLISQAASIITLQAKKPILVRGNTSGLYFPFFFMLP